MSRKQFIESEGATCRNWTWSWSFIDESTKRIIFGQWDTYQSGSMGLILSESWRFKKDGTKSAGYGQSHEHVTLVETGGYALYTFPMVYAPADADDELGPSKIKSFTPHLTLKSLVRVGADWFAADISSSDLLPEQLPDGPVYPEGAVKTVTINSYERDSKARDACLEAHGYACIVCKFDFEKTYGVLGQKRIHVHHLVPLSAMKTTYMVNPQKDLVPICPNCHYMIHLTTPPRTVEELRLLITAHMSDAS